MRQDYLFAPGWWCQGSFDGPSHHDPAVNSALRDPQTSRPFGDALGLPIKSQQPSRSLVLGLLDSRRPSAIAGFVVAVVVNALQCLTRRARPHVVQEALIRRPSLTAHYATPDIILGACGTVVSRAVSHRGPRSVFSAESFAYGRPVRGQSGSGGVGSEAPATFGFTGYQSRRYCQPFISTLAQAFPNDSFIAPLARWVQGRQASELLPGEVFCWRPLSVQASATVRSVLYKMCGAYESGSAAGTMAMPHEFAVSPFARHTYNSETSKDLSCEVLRSVVAESNAKSFRVHHAVTLSHGYAHVVTQ